MKTSEKIQIAGGVLFGLGMLVCCIAAAAFSGHLNVPAFIDGPNPIGPDQFLPSTLGTRVYVGAIITWLTGGYLALLLGSHFQNREQKLQY